jgi:pantoate--beta-alanine ligase
MSLAVVHTAHDFRRACQEARLDGEIALVPTMGFLHRGHQSLMEAAAKRAPFVAATIFVNPTQFGPNEDLSRYPRDLEGDLRKCEESGVNVVFAPKDPGEMYPEGFQTYVEPGPLALPLDGAARPGHFRGVCTIVAKLFTLSRADAAFFGEKDYQQLAIIKRMAMDLNLGTEVIGRPIVREPDGLAMSSRNSYLSADERSKAIGVYKALQAARSAYRAGGNIEQAARAELKDFHKIDYCELRHPEDLSKVTSPTDTTRLFIAAFMGKTRLIDNGALHE